HGISAPSGAGSVAFRHATLGAGTASIITNIGSWYWSNLEQDYPDTFGNGNGVVFGPWPRYVDGVDVGAPNYGYALQVSSQSQNQRLAWEFVRFMTSAPEFYLENVGLIQPVVGL